MIEKKLELGNLYDFYSELLTEKQKEVLEQYLVNDLSLAEISINANVSRQAVYDSLKRSAKILNDYEDKLGLLEKYLKTLEEKTTILNLVNEIQSRLDNEYIKEQIEKIKCIVER
ncbi:YlxM family DNA-binding protein [Helicovermis profundi]|uniref:UPF0122 protein HLPR_17330 n=1 Tax=Helicovermis profundi TaxID=3065157 RepID=A0AAU9EF83_9FIRM|nr:putative DNA-binding protein [Clostridia bacterium S502]